MPTPQVRQVLHYCNSPDDLARIEDETRLRSGNDLTWHCWDMWVSGWGCTAVCMHRVPEGFGADCVQRLLAVAPSLACSIPPCAPPSSSLHNPGP